MIDGEHPHALSPTAPNALNLPQTFSSEIPLPRATIGIGVGFVAVFFSAKTQLDLPAVSSHKSVT